MAPKDAPPPPAVPEQLALRETEGTWVLGNRDRVPCGLRVPVSFVIGLGAFVDGWVECAGDVYLAKGARVEGPVRAEGMVVLGAKACVVGPIEAAGDVIVQADAVVAGDVKSGGDVTIRPGSKMGVVKCAGDVRLTGPATTGSLLAGGRTVIAGE